MTNVVSLFVLILCALCACAMDMYKVLDGASSFSFCFLVFFELVV